MAAKRWTIVEFEQGEVLVVVHKPGCPVIAEDVAEGGSKELLKLDLEADDTELLNQLDPGGEDLESMDDVELHDCTGYATTPTPPVPQPPAQVHAAAEASRKAAAERLIKQVEEIIDKLVVARGVDDVGTGDEWASERLATCTDDYVYHLAVEVRKLRAKGDSWWRVGYELGLPGAGASNKQGRKGGAYARRLWRAAWGATYTGERSQRESKITREARAMENQGKPYFTGTEQPMDIIERVRGQMIHWVTRLGGAHGLICSAQETYVHDDPKFIRVKEGPQGPYLEFYEQLDPSMLLADPRKSITKSGPLRAVYVDRITRVGV
jgi:hypothetical protein